MRPVNVLAVLALGAGIAPACRSSAPRPAAKPVVTVSPADLGRLAPEQMGPVRTARGEVDAAQDAVARARLRLQDARQEEAYARADGAQAEADHQRGAAQLRTAREAGDGRLAARATDLVDAAALRGQAAGARLEYARRLVAAREAGVRAAEAHVSRAQWELERAKLAALRQAGIPAASKYDPAPLDRRAFDAARADEGAQARARALDRDATLAFDRWRQLVDRYEARARGAGSTG
jgi:colicin import membrane protein